MKTQIPPGAQSIAEQNDGREKSGRGGKAPSITSKDGNDSGPSTSSVAVAADRLQRVKTSRRLLGEWKAVFLALLCETVFEGKEMAKTGKFHFSRCQVFFMFSLCA